MNSLYHSPTLYYSHSNESSAFLKAYLIGLQVFSTVRIILLNSFLPQQVLSLICAFNRAKILLLDAFGNGNHDHTYVTDRPSFNFWGGWLVIPLFSTTNATQIQIPFHSETHAKWYVIRIQNVIIYRFQ